MSLEPRYEGLKGKLSARRVRFRRFVNIYINDNDVRLLTGRHRCRKGTK